MKSMDIPSSQIPAFLSKLWTLLENRSTQHLIKWDESGTSFHVYDHARFSKEVLPQYFKHNNMASFVRQLNMYGFRKIASVDQGALRSDKDDMEFHNPFFMRDNPSLLDMIKRKTTRERIPGEEGRVSDIDRVVSDVWEVRSKQDTVTSKLQLLKKENEALWREVASLRQKHAQQQQVVNKIIQLLVALAGARRGTVKRPSQLMIEDAEKSVRSPLATSRKRRKPEHPLQHLPTSPSAYRVTSPNTCADDTTLTTQSPCEIDFADDFADESPVDSPKFSSIDDAPMSLAKDPLAEILSKVGNHNVEADKTCVGKEQARPLSKNVGESSLGNESWNSALAVNAVSMPRLHSPSTDKTDPIESLGIMQDDIDHGIDGLKDMLTHPGSLDFLNNTPYSIDPSLLLGLFTPDAPGLPLLPDRVSVDLTEANNPGLIRGNEVIEYHPAEDLDFSSGIIFDDETAMLRMMSGADSSSDTRVKEKNDGTSTGKTPAVSSNDLD